MQLGIDRLLEEEDLRRALSDRRVALLGHPASVTRSLEHSLDALVHAGVNLSCAFGPQHGMRGEKQDNMIETEDYLDPVHGMPVFSLYSQTRRPTERMLDTFDVVLVDLQDVGTRIYTFITTLMYMLQGCAERGRALWVLDRPNPAGRPVEGTRLIPGWESFVGAGPLPMRHGLTMGELADWFVKLHQLDVDLKVIEMKGYDPAEGPGFGWPSDLSWVNPSPNAASLSMARAFPGTVMIEGTTLSEGRGTTRPLEVVGAPDIDASAVLARMRSLAPQWLQGVTLRPCFFEPTFHKHQKQLCSGLQLHVDHPGYRHEAFRPYRVVALFFKALRQLHPEYPLWRDFLYEYESDRLAIDLINGGPGLRTWVDDPGQGPDALEPLMQKDEQSWLTERASFLRYGA